MLMWLIVTGWVSYRMWTVPGARIEHRLTALILPLMLVTVYAWVDGAFVAPEMAIPIGAAGLFSHLAHRTAKKAEQARLAALAEPADTTEIVDVR